MTCSRKHVSKRVYALPTKSRMDVKESSVECSYPLIYYVIDDYEDMFEQLVVMEGEYLCVELAVTIPNNPERARRSFGDFRGDNDDDNLDDEVGEEDDDVSDIENYDSMATPRGTLRNGTVPPPRINTELSTIDIYASNYPYSTPFPQPSPLNNKVTLFQGAASYTALLDIYKQKTAPKVNRRFKMGPLTPPTEYVMMRGPGGKGHAQVAITATARDTDVFSFAAPASAPPHAGSTAPSHAGSTAPSHAGSTAPSHAGSTAPPYAGSTASSRPSSRPASRPGSRPGSRAPSMPPSATSSTQASPVLSASKSFVPANLAEVDNEKPKGPSRSSSTGSFFQTFKRLSLTAVTREGEGGRSSGTEAGMTAKPAVTGVNVQNPEALKCCMTFVNVPWESIIR